tara:strand:+ start:2104 stop:3594 length:1491 start_codon:yes stop_codon:yes gene_type:complete
MKTKITNNIKSILFAASMVLTVNTTHAQTQKGADIDGEAAGDESGHSVSMPDANTIAIGAYRNDGNGENAGHVRIYQWNGTIWTQKGADIDGEAAGDRAGYSVSMPDVNTIAIGAPYNEGNGTYAGHVRIYQWNGTVWTQKGADIDGEAFGDESGHSVSMPDANTIAIGALRNDGNGTSSGHVRIYQWDGTIWTQKGANIDGEAAGDQSGNSVSMPDANTIAIGAFRNDGNGADAGQVRIYQWNGTIWTQKGTDIDGEAAGDNSGHSISMPDANTIAIGAFRNDGNGTDAGQVRIYQWNGTIWTQKGTDIDGEAAGDNLGYSVSMPDANTIAIGAPYNDGNGTTLGRVRIFQWNGTIWAQKGANINGETAFGQSGHSVCMPDANTIAIGAPFNGISVSFTGHVQVYDLSVLSVIDSGFESRPKVYPNPTNGTLTINLNENYNHTNVIVRNTLGQEVLKKSFAATNLLQLNIPGEVGVYFLEINAAGKKAFIRVIKR